ncbi:MAG: hypothetical protein AAFR12_11855 [Cyanobacteria bacterium J06626_6]
MPTLSGTQASTWGSDALLSESFLFPEISEKPAEEPDCLLGFGLRNMTVAACGDEDTVASAVLDRAYLLIDSRSAPHEVTTTGLGMTASVTAALDSLSADPSSGVDSDSRKVQIRAVGEAAAQENASAVNNAQKESQKKGQKGDKRQAQKEDRRGGNMEDNMLRLQALSVGLDNLEAGDRVSGASAGQDAFDIGVGRRKVKGSADIETAVLDFLDDCLPDDIDISLAESPDGLEVTAKAIPAHLLWRALPSDAKR